MGKNQIAWSIKNGSKIIALWYGPMGIGKTEGLMDAVYLCAIGGVSCLVLKHSLDDRFTKDNTIVTHSGATYNSETKNISIDKYDLAKVEGWLHLNDPSFFKGYKVVAIDETQFLNNTELSNRFILWTFVDFLYNQCNVSVLFTSLDYWYDGTSVETLEYFNIHSNPDFKIRPYFPCSCNKGVCLYSFLKRRKDDLDVDHPDKKIVGGEELYVSCCRECFTKLRTQWGY